MYGARDIFLSHQPRPHQPAPLQWPGHPKRQLSKPEAHALFMPVQSTLAGMSANNDDWRAVFCPQPAVSACPTITMSTSGGSMPARRMAAPIAAEDKCVADKDAKLPQNEPMGVRAAPAISTSRGRSATPGDNDMCLRQVCEQHCFLPVHAGKARQACILSPCQYLGFTTGNKTHLPKPSLRT